MFPALALPPHVQGDGHTMCNIDSAEAAAKLVPSDYHLRGHMDIEKLDSALCQDIKAGIGDVLRVLFA